MKIAIIGAGWAGLAAAVEATSAGHHATVFEASHSIGGRARAVAGKLPNGTPVTLDNGQHILIGAYSETLRLLQQVGIEPQNALLRVPLTLRFPDASGLQFPNWPTPLDALAGIVTARGWSLGDKWSLLRLASSWQRQNFQCQASTTVARLCQRLSPRVLAELIAPLCLSALNTAPERASGQVFLRVLRDALFGQAGSSNLLLPRLDLSALFPTAAARWLLAHGAQLQLGTRVDSVFQQGAQWRVREHCFDAVAFATSASESVRLLNSTALSAPDSIANEIRSWARISGALAFEAISTVYAWSATANLPHPMLTLRSGVVAGTVAPAQFVFDRGQLGGPPGLLAFVVSASQGERSALQTQVLWQAQEQLGLKLQAVQTIVEKHATFACTPGLPRPRTVIAPGLLACGDYVDGPYPATLEGALRSAVAAVKAATLGVYDARTASTTNKEPGR
jgi:squalene-associated FAD-dependent desaturase